MHPFVSGRHATQLVEAGVVDKLDELLIKNSSDDLDIQVSIHTHIYSMMEYFWAI